MKDIRAHNLGVAQSVDALKDGKVDAFFWNGGLPTAAILDLVNTQGITARILPLDDVLPELQRTIWRSLYYRTVIPAATYKLPADVPVIAVRKPAGRLGHDAGAAGARHHAGPVRTAADAGHDPPAGARTVGREGAGRRVDSVPPGGHPLLPGTRRVEAVVASDTEAPRRRLTGWTARLADVLAFSLSAYALYWVVGIVAPQIYRPEFPAHRPRHHLSHATPLAAGHHGSRSLTGS